MNRTCNLSTVKNTPSEARRNTPKSGYYVIQTVQYQDIDSDIQYGSIQCIVDMIYNVLEYSDLSILDNAIVLRYYSDGTRQPLYIFKNDVIEHSFRIIKFNR